MFSLVYCPLKGSRLFEKSRCINKFMHENCSTNDVSIILVMEGNVWKHRIRLFVKVSQLHLAPSPVIMFQECLIMDSLTLLYE